MTNSERIQLRDISLTHAHRNILMGSGATALIAEAKKIEAYFLEGYDTSPKPLKAERA